MGHGPLGVPKIDPSVGAPQAEIFYHYKNALLRSMAEDRAVREEEHRAKREKRPISSGAIGELYSRYLAHLPYKSGSCTYHSFVVYFSNLRRLGWVELTGKEEKSAFQDHYPSGPSRKYFRLTQRGRKASLSAWSNPHRTLYG